MDARSRSLRKYGLTLLDYDEMVKTQDGRLRARQRAGMTPDDFPLPLMIVASGSREKARS
jgi:hypothetical protein